jgi:hypothetical protein
LIFNFVVDALSVTIKNGQNAGLITSMFSHLHDSGIVILQYAHDTIFL